MLKLLPALLIGLILACGMFTSCKKHINGPPDDTTHKCDTCNLNQDSLQKIKDSLAHAFVWTEYIDQLPGDGSPTGVWVFGPNDIFICANYLWHYDGTNFTMMHAIRNGSNTSMDGAMNGFNFFAFSKTEYWLVNGSISFHTKDGVHFDDFRAGSANACWGSSPNDVFVVGNSGQIHHFDGTSFSQMTSNTPKDLGSVWGTSSSDVWACGYNDSKGETVLLHYDGNSWTEDIVSIQNNAITGGFNGVWAFDSLGHHFVATSGALLIHKMDNQMWQIDSSLMPINSLGGGNYIGIGPQGGTSTDYFVIGPWGFIAHWNGKTWKKYKELYDYSIYNYGAYAFSMNGNTACMVGVKGGSNSWIAIGRRK